MGLQKIGCLHMHPLKRIQNTEYRSQNAEFSSQNAEERRKNG